MAPKVALKFISYLSTIYLEIAIFFCFSLSFVERSGVIIIPSLIEQWDKIIPVPIKKATLPDGFRSLDPH